MRPRLPAIVGTFVAAAIVCAMGCRPPDQKRLPAVASDTWRGTYALSPGAELAIVNASGTIDVECVDAGDTVDAVDGVDVRVERVVRAANETAARQLVPRVRIQSKPTPGKLSIETLGIEGALIGVSYEANYHVTMPSRVRLRIRARDGRIAVRGARAGVTISGFNVDVIAQIVGGPVNVQTGSGKIAVDLAQLTGEPISIRGGFDAPVDVALPADADATLSARSGRGEIAVRGLSFVSSGADDGQGRGRVVRGRINKGGVAIDIVSGAGDVSVHARSAGAKP